MTTVEKIHQMTRMNSRYPSYYSKITTYGHTHRYTTARAIRVCRSYGRKPLGCN